MSTQDQSATTPQVGDVVRLKSGGPDATVIAEAGERLTIAWIADGVPQKLEVRRPCVQSKHA